MSRLVPFALCALLLMLAGPTRAQDTSEVAFRVRMPDDVVVTASRVASTAQETGRRITVYTQQDLQSLSVNTVDQLLDVVPGLDVQSRGGFGVQSDLKMRGSTFNGVLLLLDGARINDPMTGHFLMDLPVPLSEIARVEVLRGPATALYGPDALGGVVHLITKTGLRGGEAKGTGLAGRVDGRYGTHDLYDAGGTVRHVGQNTRVSAAARGQGSNGQPVQGSNGTPLADGRGGTVRTDFKRRVGTAALSQDLGETTLYTRVGVDDRTFGAYHYYTDFPSDRAREATSTVWVQSRLAGGGATTPWRVQVSGKQHRDRYTYNADAPSNRHISRLLNVQAQATRDRGRLRITGGASGGIRGIDSNRDGLHSDASAGAFARLRWRAIPRLTINQSTRVDYDPVYGVELTPQLYVAYDLGVTTLRAGGGRVVRAPNYVERYIDSPTNQGNANLDAETAWSGEVGADVRVAEGLALHLTGFGRTTRNSIDYLRKDGVFVARNLRRAETLGLETEAAFDRVVEGKGVHLDAAYTLLNATLDARAPTSDFKYGLNSPRHLVQGNASVEVGSVTAGVQGLWKERLEGTGLATERYGVLHTRFAYRVDLAGAGLTLSAQVRNLFDVDYTEVFDAPMPGRTLLVGAKVQL